MNNRIIKNLKGWGYKGIFLYNSETLLQAIGMIINVVGEKVKETVVDDLKQTLVMLLQTSQVSAAWLFVY